MLPKKYRLTYKDIKESCFLCTVKLANLHIKVVKTNYPYSKHAVVVSKKITKKSVERNKIRRRIYNVINSDKKFLHFKEVGFIWIAQKNITDTKFYDLKEEILSFLKDNKIKECKVFSK